MRLVDEHGARLAGAASADDTALARAQRSRSYPRIREIDPYGDTIFNKLQIASLVEALDRLMEETSKQSELQWLLDLPDLAERCAADTHIDRKARTSTARLG